MHSSNIEFINSKFYNSDLATSVLGDFTNSTKDQIFLKCEFLNNKPAMVGSSVFNFMGIYENFDESIIFTNCIFKNNKGFKWYRDKIELKDCKIDSTDFIIFQRDNQQVK